jgi:hypothetical protein
MLRRWNHPPKINLRDVSCWMSIKEACKLEVSIIAKLSKERCISVVARKGHFALHINMIEIGVGPFQLEKHTPPKWAYQEYET